MTVSAPSSIAGNGTASTASPTPSAQQSLGQSDFLQLLATQLSSQDPMKPMDDTQFISQMANFSSLQQMQALNQSFTAYTTAQEAYAAPQYLGKTVTVTDPVTGQPVTGVPTAVNTTSGGTTLSINGSDFPLSSITSVSAAATASTN